MTTPIRLEAAASSLIDLANRGAAADDQTDCQAMTVCVPFVNIEGDSYRMRSHRARAEATRRAVAGS